VAGPNTWTVPPDEPWDGGQGVVPSGAPKRVERGPPFKTCLRSKPATNSCPSNERVERDKL